MAEKEKKKLIFNMADFTVNGLSFKYRECSQVLA